MPGLGNPTRLRFRYMLMPDTQAEDQPAFALLAVATVLLLIPLAGEAELLGEAFWGLHALAAAILTLRWARRGMFVSLLASASFYLLAHIGPQARLLTDSTPSIRTTIATLCIHLAIVGAVAWCVLRMTQADNASQRHAEHARLAASIFNDAADPILTLDDTGLITLFNPAAEELSGYAASEVVGRHIFDCGLLSESAVARAAYDLTLLLDGQKPEPVEFELVRQDGTRRIVESHSRPIATGDVVTGVQTMLRDVTERNEMERALRDSEERQRAIMTSLDAGVFYQTADGTVLMNPSAERILGATAQQLRGLEPLPPGRLLVDVSGNPFRDEDLPARLARRTGIAQTGVVMGVRHADGTETWLLVNARPVFRAGMDTPYAAVTSFTDITSLRQSDERYRVAMESSLDSIQMLRAIRDDAGDIVDFEYADLNQPAEEFLRVTRKQAIGARVSELFPTYIEQGFFAAFAGVVQTREPFQEELRDLTPGFDGAWIHQQITPIGDGIAITSRDITGRKQAEEALRRSENLYRTLAHNLPRGAVVLFDHDLRYIIADGPALDMIGLSKESMEGCTLHEIFPRRIARVLEPHYRSALEGHESTFEMTFGGRVFEAVTVPVHDEAGRIVAGMAMPQDVTERKHAETALRQSQQELSSLTNNIPDVIMRLDRQYRRVYVNPAGELATGRSRDDLIGKSLFDSNPSAAYIDLWITAIDRLVETRTPFAIEFEYQSPNGPRWYQAHLAPQMAPDGEVETILAVTRDITGQRLIEEALRRSQQELSSLTDNAPDIIVRFDREYRRVFANPALERITGQSRDDIIGTTLLDASRDPAYAALWVASIDAVFDSGTPCSFEFDYLSPEGQRWFQAQLVPEFSAHGAIETVLAISRDITERRQAEAALQRSQRELKTLTDNVPDNIARYNRQYQRTYVNPAFAKAIGKPLEAIIGTTIRETSLNVAHADIWEAAIDAVFERGQPIALELDFPAPNGTMWHQIRLVPELDASGQISSVLGMGRDITERKRAEDALHQSEREMKALTDNAPDAIARFDRDYRHVFANPSLATDMGLPLEQIIGKTIWETSRSGSVTARWARTLDQVFSSGEAHEAEFEYPSSRGSRWFQSRLVPEFAPDGSGSVATVLVMSRDITEARLADEVLRESQDRFRSAFDDAVVGMALVDLDGRFMRANLALCTLLGYTEDELRELDFQTITHADDLDAQLDNVRQMLAGTIETYQMEKRYIRKNGEITWILLGVSLVRDTDGQPRYFISQIQDINERKRLADELAHRAYHDPLTGLPNRGLFENRLEHALARTYRRRDQIAIMYLDLDGFKSVNDRLGHGAGDELLRQVGQRLQGCVRGSDTVARLGGDEFTILLEDVLDIMGVVRIAERIIKAIDRPFDLAEGSARVSTSIGVAFSHAERERQETMDALLARADTALYEAKRRGKGCYVLAETLEAAVVA